MRFWKTVALGAMTGMLMSASGLWAEELKVKPKKASAKHAARPAVKIEEINALKDQMQQLLEKINNLETDLKQEKEERAKIPDLSSDVQSLKGSDQDVSQRLEQIIEERAKEKADKAKEPGIKVDMEKATSKLKMYGRWASGYMKSQNAGANPKGTFGVPDAKLFFVFSPNEFNTVLTRFSLNNAVFNSIEYFYVDTNWQKFSKTRHPLGTRLGRQRLDFGQEASYVNLTEGVVTSADAANVGAVDEALQITGKMGGKNEVAWTLGTANGNAGTVADNTAAKSYYAKLNYNTTKPFSCHLSYFDSGNATGSIDCTFGGLAAGPSKSTSFSRKVVELNLRYDWKKGKVSTPTFGDSKAYVHANIGQVHDNAQGPLATDRTANYGLIEAQYNVCPKFFVGARYSEIELDKDQTATLNSVTANKYRRTSLGVGWRWSPNVALKLAYDWNKNSGTKIVDADDNLASLMLVTIF